MNFFYCSISSIDTLSSFCHNREKGEKRGFKMESSFKILLVDDQQIVLDGLKKAAQLVPF